MYISQKLRLGKYLGTNIVLWGIIMMLHAVPNSFGPFFVLRILLGTYFDINQTSPCLILNFHRPGMLESCVSPALVLIISMFYKKNEQVSGLRWARLTFPKLKYLSGSENILVLFHSAFSISLLDSTATYDDTSRLGLATCSVSLPM